MGKYFGWSLFSLAHCDQIRSRKVWCKKNTGSGEGYVRAHTHSHTIGSTWCLTFSPPISCTRIPFGEEPGSIDPLINVCTRACKYPPHENSNPGNPGKPALLSMRRRSVPRSLVPSRALRNVDSREKLPKVRYGSLSNRGKWYSWLRFSIFGSVIGPRNSSLMHVSKRG